MSDKPKLAYWNIRGLAQPIRLLLNHVGTDFEDFYYECGPAPDYCKDVWMKEKCTLGLSFPNLPFYIDGDVKLTQSNAIMRYIGRKHDLCGKSDKEKYLVDLMADQSMDFRNGFVRLCYNQNFEDLKGDYLKSLSAQLKAFGNFLGDNDWFAGGLTFVDFIMYELLDQHRILQPDCYEDYPTLSAYLKRFEALPGIKSYMESDKFLKAPLNNKMAKFGSS